MEKKKNELADATNKRVRSSKRRKQQTEQIEIENKGIELDMPRLHGMIQALMTHLESGDLKGRASVGDLVRLLQLYKELSEEQIREVEVRWVDQAEPDGEAAE